MATTESGMQTLNFYEDRYLKQHRKSSTMPGRCIVPSTHVEVRRKTKRQNSVTETQRKSCSQSPVNNPLLDSPPPARPLTLAGNIKVRTKSPASDDTNNNDYLVLSETTQIPSGHPHKHSEIIYENHRYSHATRVRKSPSLPVDHVYEMIPAQCPGFYYKTHYLTDENNYVVHSKMPAKGGQAGRLTDTQQSNSKQAATNLRTMRRIGRSVDSIRTVQDNKLRSQSTILAPQLWMKSSAPIQFANSASCDNLLASKKFGPVSNLVGSNKENSLPHGYRSKSHISARDEDVGVHKTRNSLTSPVMSGAAGNASCRNGNTSIHGVNIRATSKNNPQKHCHRHSSSYAGYTGPYENMEDVHKSLKARKSEYVNIEDYKNDTGDLNYADLDLTLSKPIEKYQKQPNSSARSSPTKSTASTAENSDDFVEYTLINIAATQAARLACAEHQQDRQRRSHSNSGKTS